MNYLTNKILTSLKDTLPKEKVGYFFIGKPKTGLSKDSLNSGCVLIVPQTTETEPATTGVQYRLTKNVDIILAKNVTDNNYRNAQLETGIDYLTNVFEGKNEDGSLRIDTILYTVLSNLRLWGMQQSNVSITYDTNEIDGAEGVVTATMALSQTDFINIQLNS